MSILKSFNKRVNIFKNFDFKVGMADLFATNIFTPSLRLKDKIKLAWLKENFSYVIDKYNSISSETLAATVRGGVSAADGGVNAQTQKAAMPPVWVLWLQGEDVMPEIIKACYKSVKANAANHPVKLITQENLKDYIKLPEHIFNLLNSKKMTLNAFANLCRLYLLYNYGGLWLDATIFITSEIKPEVFDLPFYSIKREINFKSRNVALGRWTTFLLAAKPGNILCRAVLDLLTEYWRVKDVLIDYELFDYFIYLAYENIPACKAMIDNLNLNNPDLYALSKLLNSEFNQDKFDDITSRTQFFKLTHKQKFNKLINDNKTFYAHILEQYKYN
ncbi:MAG: capsular polysaccharide synthesis protein [Synergistaceae bacterium]|nr:capsular polysaccharide synthesis protein [Synergistaceae bacterium]